MGVSDHLTERVNGLSHLIRENETQLLEEWVNEQLRATTLRRDLLDTQELEAQSRQFLAEFTSALGSGEVQNIQSSPWLRVREFLATLSTSRGQKGFTPSETATFVFSLKQPLFKLVRTRFESDARAVADGTWILTALIDKLGLFTFESYVKVREQIIARQQEEMLELSTPVVKLWDGILALPMIGTLDSGRTQTVMETLLQRIVETNSEIAIIDITGVPTVDTLVAQHLIKTVTAARLMGAECIISGIRPQIAATIVHLGVDLGNVVTKATLADAFQVALNRVGRTIQRASLAARPSSLI